MQNEFFLSVTCQLLNESISVSQFNELKESLSIHIDTIGVKKDEANSLVITISSRSIPQIDVLLEGADEDSYIYKLFSYLRKLVIMKINNDIPISVTISIL